MMDDRIIFWGPPMRLRLRRDMSDCALPRGFCGGVSVSNGRGSDSAVIDSRYKPARQRVLVSWEGSSSSHDLFSAALQRVEPTGILIYPTGNSIRRCLFAIRE